MRDPAMPDTPDPFAGVRDVEVRPLPPAEIRARGDRLRRRRTTLAVLGAAASVALVAGVIGALGSPGDQVRPEPAPAVASPDPTSGPSMDTTPASAGDSSIPEDFPLTAGVPQHDALVVEHDFGASSAICEQSVPPTSGFLDVVRAELEQPRSEIRVLQAYASGEAARAAVAGARAAVADADCTPGSPGPTAVPYTAGEDSFAFTDSIGVLHRLVTVGRGLLFVVTMDDGAEGLATSDPLLQPVIEAMTVFSDRPALPPSGSAIPADFPLDVDQTAMESDGGEMRGPSPDETGLNELELCGDAVWSDEPAERLASTATGPEYADIRELRVYPTSDEASELMTAIREQANFCTPAGPRRHRVLEADTGYDTVTWGEFYTQGLGGGPVQFTRVGRAVFAVALLGEYSEQSLKGSQEQVTEVTLKITPSMCVFTEDGC